MRASSFPADERAAIEAITKDYLLQHPEVIREAFAELDKRQRAAEAEQHWGAIKENAAAIFSSPHQVVLGNPQGDATLVEFFDYNCPHCRNTLPALLDLLKTDLNLKVVLKELPVLGNASVEAAQVAIAVRMQDETGAKYLEFHRRLLGGHGLADRARALAVAKDVGLDMARLNRDLESPEVKAMIEETGKLAEATGITGTPSYVIGNEIVVGEAGLEILKQKIALARR